MKIAFRTFRRQIRTISRSFSSAANESKMPHRLIGQPTAHTHRHLMEPSELTPGITHQEYAERRKKVVDMMKEGNALVLCASPEQWKAFDIPFRYRPNADFWYFTGVEEPMSACIIEKKDGKPIYHLFVRTRDPGRELWEGARVGVDDAKYYGCDHAYSNEQFKIEAGRILRNASDIYYNPHKNNINPFYHQTMLEISKDTKKLLLNNAFIEEVRLVKTPAEIELMRVAGKHAGEAFHEMIKFTKPGKREEDLAAKFEFEIRTRGSERVSYPCVVGTGDNACTLHYLARDQILRDGELVLVDAGAQYHGYSSDISRTYPVNGKFTPAQRLLYDAVLAVNSYCIKKCVADGKTTIYDLHVASVYAFVDILTQTGVLPREPARAHELCQQIFPHNIGHFLGIDVHDTYNLSPVNTVLKPGMVITIEPGLYIPRGYLGVRPEFHGIGIRIEDDVLITSGEPEVLTSEAPKSVWAIEKLMSS